MLYSTEEALALLCARSWLFLRTSLVKDMTTSRKDRLVSKEFMKEWGLRFLKSLNADKEEYLSQFRVEHARLLQESLQDRRKTSYSIDDVQDLFKNLQNLVEREISTAMVNLSLKGLQHLRAILEHGEEALDFLPMVHVEEPTTPPATPVTREQRSMEAEAPEITSSSRPVIVTSPPKEWLQTVEEKMRLLDERMARAFSELEQRIVRLNQQPSPASAIESHTLEQLLNEVQSLSEKLEKEQARLAEEIKTLKESLPREDDSQQVETAIALMNRQYEDIKTQLTTLQEKIEEQLTRVEPVLDSTEAESIIREMEEYVSTLPESAPSSPPPMTMPVSPSDESTRTVVLDSESIKEFRELLESTLVDIKSTLMDPLRARDELDRIERKLDEAPRPLETAEVTPEYEELRKTIETFKRKLRERDLILEHTRKALSSNPKYAALWILQELGELPLSTLGKSVGVPPVVLKKELLDFEEQGLIRFIGDDPDPIVQVVLDIPTMESS